jgi:beta-lactamase regulating signal transducer with metallopeptidase domain
LGAEVDAAHRLITEWNTRVDITVSDRLSVPAALGRREICLPTGVFSTLDAEQQYALLAHELGHLTNRDPFWLCAAYAVRRALFMQPLNGLAWGRLRDFTEEAADDFAVGKTGSPFALARALGALAPIVALGATSAIASARGGQLLRRVKRLRAGTPVASPVTPRWVAASLIVAVAVFAVCAPGFHVSPDRAGNAIPWLAPSREPPNVRMLEVRTFLRR